MGYWEDYFLWNNLLSRHFFNDDSYGEQIVLFVDSDLLNNIGKELGGEDNFKLTFQNIHNKCRGGICSEILRLFKEWKKSKQEFPPYISTLGFFVYASTLKDPIGPRDSFHRKLRSALGVPELTTATINKFSEMFTIWKDLDDWTNKEKKGTLGSFTLWGNSKHVHVSVPRFQGLISGTHLTKLPYIFFSAGISPDLLPSEQELRQALIDYGRSGASRLPSYTINILENANLNKKGSEEAEVYKLLMKLVYNQLTNWDGTIPKIEHETTHTQKINGRICLKLNRVADYVYIRVASNPVLIGDKTCFEFSNHESDIIRLICEDSPQQIHFSKRLQHEKSSGESMRYNFSGDPEIWGGFELSQKNGTLNTGVLNKEVRVFLPGDWWDLEDNWVETNRLERGCKFIIACKNELLGPIEEWLKKSSSKYTSKKLKICSPGWSFFEGENVHESYPNCPVLSLSDVTTLKLVGGFKARGTRGKKYLLDYPPSLRVEGNYEDEIVVVKYYDEGNEKVTRLEQNRDKRQRWDFSSFMLREDILNKVLNVESGKFLEDGSWEKTSIAHKIEFFKSPPYSGGKELLYRDKFGKIIRPDHASDQNTSISGLCIHISEGLQ